MYAIIKTGGKQYRVTEKDIIAVDKLAVSEGDELIIDQVLLVSGDEGVNIGSPYVEGAKVTAKVLRQFKGRKVRGFTYKAKKDERKRYGHRQQLTSVEIEKIEFSKKG